MKIIASITYIALLGITSHYIGESLPRHLFVYNSFPYKDFKWEKKGKFYDKFKIKKWKTKLPDMSRFMKDMIPKRVNRKATSKSIDLLIRETCVAESVHFILCFLSAGVYYIWKNYIGILLFLLCFLGNIPFIMIQRYNRPNLVLLKEHLIKRENKKDELSDIIM